MISTPNVPVPPPQYGGTELVVAELVDGLIDRGAEVTLFATGDSQGGFRHRTNVRANYPTPVWPPSLIYEIEHVAAAINHIMANPGRYDVIHSHCPAILSFASLFDVPVVYTVHHPRNTLLEKMYVNHPEATYIYISQRQLDLMSPLPRTAVIHHGLNPNRYHLGEPKADSVTFLGRLSVVKAPHLAVDIAREAGMNLRIGGKPHEEDARYFNNELVFRLKQPHVEYLGELSQIPKVEMLSTSRALLFPIEWEEPFGLVAIEAMLCGCPVIAFPRGSAPELIEDGITGFIARDSKQMVQILKTRTHPDLFNREQCRRRAALRFSADRMVDDHLRIYQRARNNHVESRARLNQQQQLSPSSAPHSPRFA